MNPIKFKDDCAMDMSLEEIKKYNEDMDNWMKKMYEEGHDVAGALEAMEVISNF